MQHLTVYLQKHITLAGYTLQFSPITEAQWIMLPNTIQPTQV